MKKFFIAFLALLSIVCLGLSAACKKDPVYHILTYSAQEGVTLDFGDIQSGAEVKEGYTVNFTVSFDEAVEGPRTVMVNEDALKENEEGAYSFVMEKDTVVTVNAWLPKDYNVTFEKGEDRIWFYDKDGKEITADEALVRQGGEEVGFSVKASVYYGEGKFTVTANTMILSPDSDGMYKFSVTDNTTVKVLGLELETGFTAREDGGSGTEDDPFIIEKPIDLYYMAYQIEDSFYVNFASSYFKMTADIDMKGEQIYIIGDYPEEGSTAMFSGHFDGNGHKISNYVIEDYIIDQNTGAEVPLSNIGLFGVCSATTAGNVTIKNLTLEDFEINVDGTKNKNSGFYTGGLVGMGMGVDITNCNVSGTITVSGDTGNYFSNVGGIIGNQMSFYYNEDLYYYSSVASCKSDVNISRLNDGYILAAGGISGLLSSGDKLASAYIVNSYSTGDISGAIFTGGIAGSAGAFTSVANCYATGDISADSRVATVVSDVYNKSYAGGIVGHVNVDSAISNCFFTGETMASAMSGSNNAFTGPIYGGCDEAGAFYIDSKPVAALNNEQSYKPSLGWSEEVWDFSGNYPALKANQTLTDFTVTVEYLGGDTVKGETSATCKVKPYTAMSALYRQGEDLTRFVTADSGKISYGYYFDSRLEKPVPYAYVPTGDITLYVGFVNYSSVAGTYYLDRTAAHDVILRLNGDGTYFYRDGALSYESVYSFDGVNVVLDESPAATISVPDRNQDGSVASTSTVYRVPASAAVSANGNLVFDYSLRTNNVTYNASVKAVKGIPSFAYGSYYTRTVDGAEDYTFNRNGTGTKGLTAFTYTVDGSDIVISISGTTELGTVKESGLGLDGGDYEIYDNFRGTWEKSATTNKKYTFDGKGGWSFVHFTYDASGNDVAVTEKSGSYTYSGDKIVLDDGTEAGYNADGFLELKYSETYTEVYYRENSHVGEWKYFNVKRPVTFNFGGLTSDGYGKVTVVFGVSDKHEMTYESVATSNGGHIVNIYDNDTLYGELTYSAMRGTLEGNVIYELDGALVEGAVFCLYDDFRGVWENEELGTVEFNGLGIYDMAGTANYTKTSGTVKINGGRSVQYKLSASLMEGEFTYDSVTYTLSYDEETGTVLVKEKDGEKQYVLEKRA